MSPHLNTFFHACTICPTESSLSASLLTKRSALVRDMSRWAGMVCGGVTSGRAATRPLLPACTWAYACRGWWLMATAGCMHARMHAGRGWLTATSASVHAHMHEGFGWLMATAACVHVHMRAGVGWLMAAAACVHTHRRAGPGWLTTTAARCKRGCTHMHTQRVRDTVCTHL